MSVTVNTTQLEAKLKKMMDNKPAALMAAGLVILALSQQSIKNSGPGWAPFKLPPKKPHQLLWLTGTLIQSLGVGGSGDILRVSGDTVTVGSSVAYAARQNFGYPGGGGKPKKSKARRAYEANHPWHYTKGDESETSSGGNPPARPFLFVDEDRRQKAAQAFKVRLLQGINEGG